MGIRNANEKKSTLKEFLGQALEIDRLLKSKNEQINRLRDSQVNVNAKLEQVKVQSSPDYDKLNKITDDIVDLEKEYLDDIARFIDAKSKIKKVIANAKTATHILILEERYINLKDWDDISADNGYSKSRLYELHGEALRELANRIIRAYIELL